MDRLVEIEHLLSFLKIRINNIDAKKMIYHEFDPNCPHWIQPNGNIWTIDYDNMELKKLVGCIVSICGSSYRRVNLSCDKKYYLHHLVMEYWGPKCPYEISGRERARIQFINKNTLDCNIDNLRWKYLRVLTDEEEQDIIDILTSGGSKATIEKKYGLGYFEIDKIISGKRKLKNYKGEYPIC